MTATRTLKTAAGWAVGTLAVAAAGYAAAVGAIWWRYGRRRPGPRADPVLDRFLPEFDVEDWYRVRIQAPAEVVFAAAKEADLQRSAVVRAIFKAREAVLGAEPDTAVRPRGLLALTKSLGWGVLEEIPGRRIVMGAVTRPWFANVTFRAVPPEAFRTFAEPDYVKIVWTLGVEPDGPDASIFRTETRVATTDAAARAKFRWYWARFSPGIVLIRRLIGRRLRADLDGRTAARPA